MIDLHEKKYSVKEVLDMLWTKAEYMNQGRLIKLQKKHQKKRDIAPRSNNMTLKKYIEDGFIQTVNIKGKELIIET